MPLQDAKCQQPGSSQTHRISVQMKFLKSRIIKYLGLVGKCVHLSAWNCYRCNKCGYNMTQHKPNTIIKEEQSYSSFKWQMRKLYHFEGNSQFLSVKKKNYTGHPPAETEVSSACFAAPLSSEAGTLRRADRASTSAEPQDWPRWEPWSQASGRSRGPLRATKTHTDWLMQTTTLSFIFQTYETQKSLFSSTVRCKWICNL